MQLFTPESPLEWGSLDLPLVGISADWQGSKLDPPAAFTVAADDSMLWFVATRQSPAATHPDAAPGAFTAGLWEHDVAELFIADAAGSYLEFNLAANGAWWACKFDSARNPSVSQPDFADSVATYWDCPEQGSWLAALAVPIKFLQQHIGFGLESRANAAFILNSPNQTFHSATRLPGSAPDFHQPQAFQRLIPAKPSMP